ncbi:hypothetical protein [Microcoleus sp. bin38.metabat.b11b12b14.051]|uniref:hypothetical protein n=1 Tax=Microcoleus sp. bin38.metabat.b11b12b14.051 TaxID=2742709 RepID=UPI0025F6045E|nr:hypothetical protein [Microcoleus sp. bin38.metabat.b11b12b14.051]
MFEGIRPRDFPEAGAIEPNTSIPKNATVDLGCKRQSPSIPSPSENGKSIDLSVPAPVRQLRI